MTKVLVDMDEVLNVDEAASQLQKGVATIWRWIRDGKITVVRLSGRTLIPKTEVERLASEKVMARGLAQQS